MQLLEEGWTLMTRFGPVDPVTAAGKAAEARNALGHVSMIRGLRRWRDALVQANALHHSAYGCALGSLASEVADHDDVARHFLSQLFTEWQGLLASVLRRLHESGSLPPEASIDQLATGLMGALQGGYMLVRATRDITSMATSIDMAPRSADTPSQVYADQCGT
jgi:hypothetical protein